MRDCRGAEPLDRPYQVTEDMTAHHHGNPGFAVLATPVVVELVEATAVGLLDGYLDAGEGSVGIAVELEHTAPTPVGRTATVTVRVTGQEGRMVSFDVDVRDDAGPIARGRHRRAVIDRERFLERAGVRP